MCDFGLFNIKGIVIAYFVTKLRRKHMQRERREKRNISTPVDSSTLLDMDKEGELHEVTKPKCIRSSLREFDGVIFAYFFYTLQIRYTTNLIIVSLVMVDLFNIFF